MKRSLFSKMVATYTLIIAVSFIFIATILSIWFQGYYFDQRKKLLISEKDSIEEATSSAISNSSSISDISGQGTLEDKLNEISKYINSDILFVDKNGFGFAASSINYKKYYGIQVLDKELERLRNFEDIESNGGYSATFASPVYTYITPIKQEGQFSGAIIFNTPIKDIQGKLNEVYWFIWFSAMLAVAGAFFIIYYFSEKIIISPLSEIIIAAQKISKGEVGRRVIVHSNDEIGELSSAFNALAESIEQVENNRRVFISNVSHELRSPITSIKGFIGGILDGVIPKEKESYYLSITYDEIQRLTRLVNDLLDLSTIESGNMTMNMRNIDINEVVRLCVIKFEPQIKDKKMNVDVCFDRDDLYVLADRDRIIQVVTNLLDNAIKYGRENGNVQITTKTKGLKVYVSFYNDGPKISEEDLKHIWDRFYKAEKSRTTKASTGLGLPIVRSILTQHGEDIWIKNGEEKGVTFTFTLKRV